MIFNAESESGIPKCRNLVEMMEYKISNENVKDTTSKVLEIMETQNV